MAYSPTMQAALGLNASNPLPAGYNYKAGGTANFSGVNFSELLNKYNQDRALPTYNGDGEAGLDSMMARQARNFGNGQAGQSSWGYGGYDVIPLPNGGYGLAKGTAGAPNGTGYGIYGEQPMDVYDGSGKFLGTGQTPKGLNPNDESGKQFAIGAMFMAPMALAAMGALGGGAAAAGSGGGAEAAATFGGHSLGGAGVAGGLEGSALGSAAGVGTAAGLGGASASTGGLGSIVSALGGSGGTAAKVGTSLLGALTGGGGSSNNGSLGGMSLSDIANIVSGVYGANQQSQSSKDMMDWLNGQQAKIDNLYAPNSPEYNYLWDQMSRQDAAAGRNSQYGPRSVDLAARIAQIKADETARLTQGVGALRANTLNQGANAGINATAPIIKALQGSGLNLGRIISMLGGGSSNSTDFWNQVDQSGSNWGGGYTNPVDQDFLDFINQYGME